MKSHEFLLIEIRGFFMTMYATQNSIATSHYLNLYHKLARLHLVISDILSNKIFPL